MVIHSLARRAGALKRRIRKWLDVVGKVQGVTRATRWRLRPVRLWLCAVAAVAVVGVQLV